MNARYLDPATGTFLTGDPFEGMADNSMSRNPVNRTDRSGKCFDPVSLLVCAAIGIGAVFAAGNAYHQVRTHGYVKDWGSVVGSGIEAAGVTLGVGFLALGGLEIAGAVGSAWSVASNVGWAGALELSLPGLGSGAALGSGGGAGLFAFYEENPEIGDEFAAAGSDISDREARLIEAVDAEGERLKSAAVSKNQLSPVAGGVLNPEDNLAVAGNDPEKVVTRELHSVIQNRIDLITQNQSALFEGAQQEWIDRAGVPGFHGEIYSLDELLNAEDEALGRTATIDDLSPSDYLIHAKGLKGS